MFELKVGNLTTGDSNGKKTRTWKLPQDLDFSSTLTRDVYMSGPICRYGGSIEGTYFVGSS